MDNVMIIVKSAEESGLLTKVISETIKDEAKEQKSGFLGMLDALAASLLEKMLVGKTVVRRSEGTGEGGISASEGQDF